MPVSSKPLGPPFRLYPEDARVTTFPLFRPALFKYYEDATAAFWNVKEVPLSTDAADYKNKLSPEERHFLRHVLAFFASADGLVNVNLAKRFKEEVPLLEAGYFYDFQIAMENVHAHMYSLLITELIPSQEERDTLINAVKTVPVIAKIAKYITDTVESDAPFAERLLRMACIEGILFQGCFCLIGWMSEDGRMPGLAQSNELIARDEALHTMFALFLYTLLEADHKLSHQRIKEIVCELVGIAGEFIDAAIPKPMAGMNASLMVRYIESQADNVVYLIDCPVIYGSKHNFHFMDKYNMLNQTNFFERRTTEYSAKKTADAGDGDFTMDF